jgi:hypothetical protein
MYVTAKMEGQKAKSGYVILQDINSVGLSCYYTYSTPFFNYGLISQTWEDLEVKLMS